MLRLFQYEEDLVEVPSISRASFNKLVPFYVVEQSLRCCLCVHCYRGKLATIALCEHWSTLHQGTTPGSACDCTCELCKEGGCATYLPYETPKAVSSMGNLSDKLLCDKVDLYSKREGGRVSAHKSVCVSGFCSKCSHKQDRFFGCPRNQGDAQRQLVPPLRNPNPYSTADPSQGPPGEMRWSMFTTVDEHGNAANPNATSSRGGRQGDGEDGDWDPRGGADKKRARKVRNCSGSWNTKTITQMIRHARYPKLMKLRLETHVVEIRRYMRYIC